LHDARVRVRVRLHVTSCLAKQSKSNLPAKPRPAARPIGSAGGPTCRPIGTPGIDVSAKFRNAVREGARGGRRWRGAPAACPSVGAVRSVPRWSRGDVRSCVVRLLLLSDFCPSLFFRSRSSEITNIAVVPGRLDFETVFGKYYNNIS